MSSDAQVSSVLNVGVASPQMRSPSAQASSALNVGVAATRSPNGQASSALNVGFVLPVQIIVQVPSIGWGSPTTPPKVVTVLQQASNPSVQSIENVGVVSSRSLPDAAVSSTLNVTA